MNNPDKHLILLELNEINFDVVEWYVAADVKRFPALKKLLSNGRIRTSCEKEYEELEPWIQWASVHTGKTYAEHGVFRLGDMVGRKVPQIFELLEGAGLMVGAISAMNAENRLRQPAYFIPDPWTQTPADDSFWSRALSEAVVQTVNDNAQARITTKSAVQVLLALVRFARTNHYIRYLSLVLQSRKKPWLKALVLDLLLHDVHWSLFNTKKPNFSTIFLNAGAHIQHHYFFNATPVKNSSPSKNPAWYVKEDEDPLADILGLYDMIIGELFSRKDTEVLLVTGLAQKPYDRVKFYYRLKSHETFLRNSGVAFSAVYPRMTRDFLIEFESEQQAGLAQKILGGIVIEDDGLPLFGEIDNRGNSLFVTLTYPHEVIEKTMYVVEGQSFPLQPEVSFVAIKNGMHQEEGFAFFTPGIAPYVPENGAHVARVADTILNYFGIPLKA
jgi:hypothetical protein